MCLQPVLLLLLLLLPSSSSPSLCRDFDGPKVSLKAELFNSVSCHECLGTGWLCAHLSSERKMQPQSMSSVWWSKVHDKGGNNPCQVHHSQHYNKGDASGAYSFALSFFCLNSWNKSAEIFQFVPPVQSAKTDPNKPKHEDYSVQVLVDNCFSEVMIHFYGHLGGCSL